MTQVTVTGIDIGKTSFHLAALDPMLDNAALKDRLGNEWCRPPRGGRLWRLSPRLFK